MPANSAETNKTRKPGPLEMGGLDANEVIEMSEQLSELDHESRSMLFLMCLSTFNDLQNKFVQSYKKRLLFKKNRYLPLTKEQLSLYAALKEPKDSFLNSPLVDESESGAEGVESATPLVQEHRGPQISLLRTLWRRYRIDFFIKVMLIIFLLKLPYVFYVVTIILYALYCVGFFGLIARLSRNLRNSHNAQAIVRHVLHILDSIEPLLLIPLTQNNAQGRNAPGPNARAPAAGPSTGQQAPPTDNAGAAAASTSSGETSDNAHAQTQGESDANAAGEQAQAAQPREKPSYFEKFIYQVFISFVLSVLPWWEPNPIYLEE